MVLENFYNINNLTKNQLKTQIKTKIIKKHNLIRLNQYKDNIETNNLNLEIKKLTKILISKFII